MNSPLRLLLGLALGAGAITAMAGPVSSEVASAPGSLAGELGKGVDLALEANPTTGYSWMVKRLPASLILESGDYGQSQDCPPGAVGCGGTFTYRFIGQKVGQDKLVLIYGRPWDKDSWETKEIQVQIR